MAAIKKVRRAMAGLADASDADDSDLIIESEDENNEKIKDCIEIEDIESGSNWSGDK